MAGGPQTQGEAPLRGGRLGFWLALLTMFAICVFAVYRSALFRLERVQVTGTNRLSQAEVLDAAGLRPGMLKWEAPASRVEERLLADPRIRSVRAVWNGNRLLIEITEREPIALLRYYERFYLEVDEEGYVLGQRMLSEGDRLPVIGGITVTEALRGERIDDLGLMDGLSVLAWFAPAFREQISEVEVRDDRSIRMYMVGGTTVEWGVLPESPAARDEFIQMQVKGFGDFWERIPRSKLAECQVDLRVAGYVHGIGCD